MPQIKLPGHPDSCHYMACFGANTAKPTKVFGTMPDRTSRLQGATFAPRKPKPLPVPVLQRRRHRSISDAAKREAKAKKMHLTIRPRSPGIQEVVLKELASISGDHRDPKRCSWSTNARFTHCFVDEDNMAWLKRR
mmetsp:Transcript_50631/g.80846  ORF Transcript_50631/g.80846 Transcript_50631/m.80846 type:complete len:136 (+) Transcript_50631:299-706(+)